MNWNICSSIHRDQEYDGNVLLDTYLPLIIGILSLDNCNDAVNILKKQDLAGRKVAEDAAYNLAAQLLVAMVNMKNGAIQCDKLIDTVSKAQILLASIKFNGTGDYLRQKGDRRQKALEFATILDGYNNGILCPCT